MVNKEEQEYLDALKTTVNTGVSSNDRTGVGTKYLFSQKFDYDISNGKIPIWTTRKVPWRNQVWELIWMINGNSNIKWLQDRDVHIWDSWTDEQGNIGPTYSKQLRSWEDTKNNKTIDQLQNLITGLKTNPESRRHIISLWNVADMNNLTHKNYLPVCHSNHIQIVIENNKYLNYQMVQRSADACLGYCPWQHALFANIIGKLTGYEPKQMSVVITNFHVYNNQTEKALKQIERVPTEFPTLKINKKLMNLKDVEASVLSDYELVNYEPQSFIKYPIAV